MSDERCGVCGSTEIVSVKGAAALAAFPSGRRCAHFFSHYLSPEPAVRRRLCARVFIVSIFDAPFGIGHVEVVCQKLEGHRERGDLAHYGTGYARHEDDETLVELTQTQAWYDADIDMMNRSVAEAPVTR